MAYAVVTITIMPESPDSDLVALEKEAHDLIKAFNDNRETKIEIKPIAFGLKSINITFMVDEKKGSPDQVSEKIAKLNNVSSAEVTDVRRALG